MKINLRMKKRFFAAILAIAILIPAKVSAWGLTGHRVVAEIAQQNINAKASKKINELLDGLPMAYWANWPDFIKSDKTGEWDHTHIWHYVNAPGYLSKEDYIAYIKNVKQDNIYSEIPKLIKALRDNVSSPEQKRIALIFLVHLIGDAHQPMHEGREEDLGGNKVFVIWFNEPSNLHSVWDNKLVDYEKYSYSEYAHILNCISKDKKQRLAQGALEDWLFESYTYANQIYSSVKDGDKLMYEYSFQYKSVMELQLQRAGLRLAAILNSIWK
jgi:hypothetical protein